MRQGNFSLAINIKLKFPSFLALHTNIKHVIKSKHMMVSYDYISAMQELVRMVRLSKGVTLLSVILPTIVMRGIIQTVQSKCFVALTLCGYVFLGRTVSL